MFVERINKWLEINLPVLIPRLNSAKNNKPNPSRVTTLLGDSDRIHTVYPCLESRVSFSSFFLRKKLENEKNGI